MQGFSRQIRRTLTVIVAVGAACGAGSVVLAHDDIESSVPAHQSQIDEPISEVTINFGAPVDDVELALVGPDDRDVPGDVVVVSDTAATLEFEPLTAKGEYLVRYLAQEDGHLVGGAISFVYGERTAEGVDPLTWALFGLGAALILAIGAYFSLRRARSADPLDADLVDSAAT